MKRKFTKGLNRGFEIAQKRIGDITDQINRDYSILRKRKGKG